MSGSDNECPICLQPSPLLVSSCGHKICRICFERVLLNTSSFNNHRFRPNDAESNAELFEDAVVSACPTKGRCPMCRKLINLFDLKEYRDHEEEEHKGSGVSVITVALHDAYEKMTDISSCPLAGISMGNRGRNMLFEFPAIADQPPVYVKKDSGSGETLMRLPFEDGFHYHEKSKCFLGNLDFTKTDGNDEENSEKWECIMQFSSDFRHVLHGAIIKRPAVEADQNEENYYKRFPLSGKWTVRWQRSDQKGVDRNSLLTASMEVIRNSISMFGRNYHIQLGSAEEERVHFYWPGSTEPNGQVLQVAESGIDLKNQPEGPDVGQTIIWTVSSPDYHRIFWTRETKEVHSPSRFQQLGRGGILLLQQRVCQSVKPTYHEGSPWGNVFVQFHTVGLASYHFISPDGENEDGAYISYESVRCSDWPPLDDGSPVPSRVPFTNRSYDPETRTFRGTISWFETYGTCWQGNALWLYEIVFDSEFLCIISGGVTMSSDEQLMSTSHNIHQPHNYGEHLNYINAGIVGRIVSLTNGSIPDVLSEIGRMISHLNDEEAEPRDRKSVV